MACKLVFEAEKDAALPLLAALRDVRSPPEDEMEARAMSLELSRELLYIEGEELSECHVDPSEGRA